MAMGPTALGTQRGAREQHGLPRAAQRSQGGGLAGHDHRAAVCNPSGGAVSNDVSLEWSAASGINQESGLVRCGVGRMRMSPYGCSWLSVTKPALRSTSDS